MLKHKIYSQTIPVKFKTTLVRTNLTIPSTINREMQSGYDK